MIWTASVLHEQHGVSRDGANIDVLVVTKMPTLHKTRAG